MVDVPRAVISFEARLTRPLYAVNRAGMPGAYVAKMTGGRLGIQVELNVLLAAYDLDLALAGGTSCVS